MADFRVWAPRAEAVTLLLAGRERPMHPARREYWVAEYDDAAAGDDYAFILDGGEPIPDPRSPWQPDGIHGLSRLVDHEAFEWSDAGWAAPRVEEAVIYELHVGTFTPEGTFEAAIARLPS